MNYKDISYSESNPICTVESGQQTIDILKNTEGKTIYVGNKASDSLSCVGNYSKQTLTITSDTAGCSGTVSQNDETAGKISINISKNDKNQDRIIIYKINNIALIYIKQLANATDAINYYIHINVEANDKKAYVKFEQPTETGGEANVSIYNLTWVQTTYGQPDISKIEIIDGDGSDCVDFRNIANYVELVDLNDNYRTYAFKYLTFDLNGNEDDDSKYIFKGYLQKSTTGSFIMEEEITFQSGHTYQLQWKDSANIPNIFNLGTTPSSDNYIFKGFNWDGPPLQYTCIRETTFRIYYDDSTDPITQVKNATDNGFTFYYKIKIAEDSQLSSDERNKIRNYIYNNIDPDISNCSQQYMVIKNHEYEILTACSKTANTKADGEDNYTIITNKISVSYSDFYTISSPDDNTKYRLYIKLYPIIQMIENVVNDKQFIEIDGVTYKLDQTFAEASTYHAIYEYNGYNLSFLEIVGEDIN